MRIVQLALIFSLMYAPVAGMTVPSQLLNDPEHSVSAAGGKDGSTSFSDFIGLGLITMYLVRIVIQDDDFYGPYSTGMTAAMGLGLLALLVYEAYNPQPDPKPPLPLILEKDTEDSTRPDEKNPETEPGNLLDNLEWSGTDIIEGVAKEEEMDETYLLTSDVTEFEGIIRTQEVVQESEGGDADEHIMIFILELLTPAVFKDADGEEMMVSEIHLYDSSDLDFLSSSDRACTIKGTFYKQHHRTHHKPVIADRIAVVYKE